MNDKVLVSKKDISEKTIYSFFAGISIAEIFKTLKGKKIERIIAEKNKVIIVAEGNRFAIGMTDSLSVKEVLGEPRDLGVRVGISNYKFDKSNINKYVVLDTFIVFMDSDENKEFWSRIKEEADTDTTSILAVGYNLHVKDKTTQDEKTICITFLLPKEDFVALPLITLERK